jgi:hypothetical protein
MMVQQFKSGIGGLGVGFVVEGVGGDKLYCKIGECSQLKPSEMSTSSTTPKLTKITPPKPLKPNTKYSV